MHPPTALVVHDRPSSYQAVRGILEGAGFEIIGAAGNLTDGMELLRSHVPNVAVVDLDVEGLASVHALHEAAPGCALFVLSRHPERAEAVVQAGALAVLDPQDLHQLDAAIRNIRVRLEQSAGQES